jgi:hypothetical protein
MGILGSHGDDYEVLCLLRRDAIQSGMNWRALGRNVDKFLPVCMVSHARTYNFFGRQDTLRDSQSMERNHYLSSVSSSLVDEI